jgi:hypothetical protein
VRYPNFFVVNEQRLKVRLTAHEMCTGNHVPASAMDTTLLFLTPTTLGLAAFIVRHIYVRPNISPVGSRTRSIILSLDTHPALLLYGVSSACLIVFT